MLKSIKQRRIRRIENRQRKLKHKFVKLSLKQAATSIDVISKAWRSVNIAIEIMKLDIQKRLIASQPTFDENKAIYGACAIIESGKEVFNQGGIAYIKRD
jgi:hypothetical protein